MQVRLATQDDEEAIWQFWEELELFDPYWACAPGRHHPNRSQLEAWLRGDFAIALCDDNGIVMTEVFNPRTARSHVTNVQRERFADAVPAVFSWVKERVGCSPWGACVSPEMTENFLSIGFTQTGRILRWT
jgi:hypothetical protein